MINQIHALVFRPSLGWDPVSSDYAQNYADSTQHSDFSVVEDLKRKAGDLTGKKVLDLGGGPGWFSMEFARLGADVLWWDVSRRYQTIAMQNADEANLNVKFRVDYLENIGRRQFENTFDVIFNRVCWYYCQSDKSFARSIMRALKPGGLAYVETMNSDYYELRNAEPGVFEKFQRELYHRWGLKVGHPHAASGTLERIFLSLGNTLVQADYHIPGMDRVWIRRT